MMQDIETLMPVLVHIQANIGGDLGLDALARKAGLSAFHFQRLFKSAIGESPKQYTLRVSLERAAFRLLVHETKVLDLALECGFANHETFTRAFRRRFGTTPLAFRNQVRTRAREALQDNATQRTGGPFELSPTRVARIRPFHAAFVRHIGPYESVPESIFHELERWAARRALPEPPVWMGAGHDSPVTTPPELLRFDALLRVPGPFAPEGRVAHQFFPGGEFAVTTHVGPYETLPAAYAEIFPRLFAIPGYQVIGLPAVEMYMATRVTVREVLNHTDICLPLSRLGG